MIKVRFTFVPSSPNDPPDDIDKLWVQITAMSGIVDDKSDQCISFVLERLQNHQQSLKNERSNTPPLFIGVNGTQGAGKTTLVSRERVPNTC